MSEQIRNNRPRLQIKDMDKYEKELYIKDPLKMLGVFISVMIIFSVGFFIKERSLNGVYIVVGVFSFLILFIITDWWEAFNTWRNWGTWKRNHPEEWRQMKEEREEAKKKEKEKITH